MRGPAPLKFTCDLCESRWPSKYGLKQHKRTCAGAPAKPEQKDAA